MESYEEMERNAHVKLDYHDGISTDEIAMCRASPREDTEHWRLLNEEE